MVLYLQIYYAIVDPTNRPVDEPAMRLYSNQFFPGKFRIVFFLRTHATNDKALLTGCKYYPDSLVIEYPQSLNE